MCPHRTVRGLPGGDGVLDRIGDGSPRRDIGQALEAQMPPGEAAARAGDQPALGWTVVLRRQPVRIVDGQVEAGQADAFEIICCDCGDHPDLDYCEVSPELQRIRGPYTIVAGVVAYREHLDLHHRRHARVPVTACDD